MSFPFSQIVELICSLFALICLKDNGKNIWTLIKWFIPFTFLIEFASWIINNLFHQHTAWLYTLYLPANFIILYLALYKLLPEHKYNKPLLIIGLVLFAVCYSKDLLSGGIFVYADFSDTIATFFALIGCNWFFYLLLKKDEWINIPAHAAFWFVTGLFLFSFCTIVTGLFAEQLLHLFVTEKLSLRFVLFQVFNFILYGCWSYAFVCKYRETI